MKIVSSSPNYQIPTFQSFEASCFAIPKLETEDYSQVINRIMTKLPINVSLVSDKISSINHIRYTLKHKLAIMALSYEYLGYVSKRIMLHDTEKLVLYTIIDPKQGHNYHRSLSIHHSENFSCQSDATSVISQTEAIFDYECARYTKPDKPLNAYATIHKYYPDDFLAAEPLLRRFSICSPENRDCAFEQWDIVAGIYLPLFEWINTKAINQMMAAFTLDTIESHLKKYNTYLSTLDL